MLIHKNTGGKYVLKMTVVHVPLLLAYKKVRVSLIIIAIINGGFRQDYQFILVFNSFY